MGSSSAHVESVLRAAAELEAEGVPFVLVTVVRTQGRTPRNPGAKLIWRPDNPAIGTIGGGAVEEIALDEAAAFYEKRHSGTSSHVLGQEAGQCCGGRMEFFYDYIGPTHRLVIFGAGHVARALVNSLRGLRFEITIVDDRPEWNSPERFPGCSRVLDYKDGIAETEVDPGKTCACIMTYSHDIDYMILKELLQLPLAYTGLIGSQSKRACFVGRLSAQGVAEERIAAMTCPMGLGRGGKEPQAVAISIAAELLHVTSGGYVAGA